MILFKLVKKAMVKVILASVMFFSCSITSELVVNLDVDNNARSISGGDQIFIKAQTISVKQSNLHYQWFVDGVKYGTDENIFQFSKNPIESSSYVVTVEVSEGKRIGVAETILHVNRKLGPTVSIIGGSRVSLYNEKLLISASVSTSTGEFADLTWFLDNELLATSGSQISVQLKPDEDKLYQVRVEAADSSGTSSDTVSLRVLGEWSVKPEVVLARSSYQAFYGFPLVVTADAVDPLGREIIWTWFLDGELILSGSSENSVDLTFTPSSQQQHKIKVMISCGDQTQIAYSTIQAMPSGEPALTILPGDQEVLYKELYENPIISYQVLTSIDYVDQVVWYVDNQYYSTGGSFSLADIPFSNLSYVISARLTINGITQSDTVNLTIKESSLSRVSFYDTPGKIILEPTLSNQGEDLYFIFTNNSPADSYDIPVVTNLFDDGSAEVSESSSEEVLSQTSEIDIYDQLLKQVHDAEEVVAFNASPPQFESGASSRAIEVEQESHVGDRRVFLDYTGRNIDSTLQALSPKVLISDGTTRQLEVWVENSSWYQTGDKPYMIDENMADTLQELFLQPGLDNDIYDWVTSIAGAEWGSHQWSNLINTKGSISILLCDIDDDSSVNGGVIGYFSSANNYYKSTVSISNERLMFCIDSVLYAKPDNSVWEWKDRWPAMLVSSLAHEFQHMIHFYRKRVLMGQRLGSETWLDEMCSLSVEDLTSSKLGIPSPASSRLNSFVACPTTPVSRWLYGFEVLDSYATAYSFGSFLMRNFGGPELLYDIINGDETDFHAVEEAVFNQGYDYTFSQILQRWGAANLLSQESEQNAEMSINREGGFSFDYKGSQWNLINQNLYYYYYWDTETATIQRGPDTISNTIYMNSLPGHSNSYLCAGRNLKGKQQWEIELPERTSMTMVIK